MNDVIIDLETWGLGETSVIVQIGACYFDRYTGEIGETVQINIDADSSIKEGFTVDAGTINWWLGQSKEARASIVTGPKIPVRLAMMAINEFLEEADSIWSHAGFDFPKLNYHLTKLDITPTFSHKACKDIRTLDDITSKKDFPDHPFTGVPHSALDDCLHQVKYCVNRFNYIRELTL